MRSGPTWRGTVLYPLALVSLFLALQLLARALGLPDTAWPLFAAPWALLALLLTLPSRLRRVWREPAPWRRLGVVAPAGDARRALLRGLGGAALLLGPISLLLLWSGLARWQPALNGALVANALALGLGVGFAEELLFRGWLWGELAAHLGAGRGALAQAVVFSLVHARLDLGGAGLVGLLVGLGLLGLALALRRWVDGGLLWGAVGLHGGLVGGWFALEQGVLAIGADAPLWLVGPGGASPNPVGGLLGWLGLAGLCALLARARRQAVARGIADNARSCP
ncbi:MAG: CPBP family intramembrane glutamic endopeptidase [Cyanobacteriota bacterium]|nr:CPBP family intramembrane glutamic endopeptidase [Cyanobacteriota bacterium]